MNEQGSLRPWRSAPDQTAEVPSGARAVDDAAPPWGGQVAEDADRQFGASVNGWEIPPRRSGRPDDDILGKQDDHPLRRDGETLALLVASPVLLGRDRVQVLDLRGDGGVAARSTSLVTTVRRLKASEV